MKFPSKKTVPLAVAAGVVAGMAGVVAHSGWPGAAGVAMLVTILVAERRRIAADAMHPDAEPAPIRAPIHPVSRLQTREPLLARMAAEGRGTLGVLALKDYDRLCAFDPDSGDRVLRSLAERVRLMLPPARMVAHVDRGHLAIWIDRDVGRADAERELHAVTYALGNAVGNGENDILPEVALRRLAFDGEVEAPDVALTRTIASFAVLDGQEEVAPDDARARARERFHLEQDLRQAIARGELQLVYQPLVDAGEGRICGAEALMRWNRREGGPVSPARFVPIVEAAGLSREIGLWALNTAIREVAGWRRRDLPHLRVAVNVSGQQLRDDDLPTLIARTLARHSIGPDALEVELTESVALDNGLQAARLVGELRAQGIAVAIDDFGTGFSSLSTLRTLKFDKIKIDREFVTDVHKRPESQAICQSVLALGRGLGIRVLAEGAEQREEVEWLRQHGCRYFQGYYFAQPLGADAFVACVGDTDRLAALLAHGPEFLQQRIVQRLSA